MRVRLYRDREGGKVAVKLGPRRTSVGDLYLAYKPTRERTIPVLTLLGADIPGLYDPRLVALSTDRMRFLGYERDESGWHLQEWVCDLEAG